MDCQGVQGRARGKPEVPEEGGRGAPGALGPLSPSRVFPIFFSLSVDQLSAQAKAVHQSHAAFAYISKGKLPGPRKPRKSRKPRKASMPREAHGNPGRPREAQEGQGR